MRYLFVVMRRRTMEWGWTPWSQDSWFCRAGTASTCCGGRRGALSAWPAPTTCATTSPLTRWPTCDELADGLPVSLVSRLSTGDASCAWLSCTRGPDEP